MKEVSRAVAPDEDTTSEQKLVAEAANGSTQAFRMLYEQTIDRVYAVCIRMTADADIAMDLCQEAYVNAWKALPRFEGTSSFATWLHRIAVNAVLSHFRKNKRRNIFVNRDGFLDENLAHENSHQPGLRMDLENALAKLPPKARHIIVLFDIEGYSHDDIAKMLGITVGTSKSQLHRARKLVREMMNE